MNKTPEEIIDEIENESRWVLPSDLIEEIIIPVMEEYGKQQYNQAIKDAESKVYSFSNDKIDKVHQSCVKKSILKLLKP